MSLKEYRAKRSLKSTPEPTGKGKKSKKEKALIFVVQKHAARRLHFDFRLEMDGVLKSWAVPKGPSLDPGEKRLAIHVEDHPLDYADFEGTIPKGHYGAGKVIVWDQGTYESNESLSLQQQYAKGELKFTLHGKKLHGDFALIKLKRNDPEDNNWLLIKKRDEYSSKEDVTEDTTSAISDATLGDSRAIGVKKRMPHLLKPMLATLVDKPFNDKDWIFEVKWDGYRAIAEVTPRKISLYSRNLNSFTDRFPVLVQDLRKCTDTVVLDGEIVLLDKEGRPQFQLMQNFLQLGEEKGALRYCVFDLLYYKDRDLRGIPLLKRRELLRQLMESIHFEFLLFSESHSEKGVEFFKAAKKEKLEGIVAKNIHSVYESKRSRDWLKIKVSNRQEFVIVGFTAPRGSRKLIGALILGIYKGKELIYAGHVGGGFDSRSLKGVHDLLQPLIIKKCPFKAVPKTNTAVTWVKPMLVCEVSFQEFTKEGIVRQPIFQGIRADKPAKEVHRE